MKFFLDTEFMEDGRSIEMLSIGVVAEDGREFYRQNANADLHKANAWVRENVLPRLAPCPVGLAPTFHRGAACSKPAECPWRPSYIIARELREFVNPGSPNSLGMVKPEFWGYYADYDWVAVCFLYGRMTDLPFGWPQYCRDIKQWCDDLGDPQLPEQGIGEHNALEDARWNRKAWEFLLEIQQETIGKGVYVYAGQRDKQQVPTREVSQEPGRLRELEEAGQVEVGSGGD